MKIIAGLLLGIISFLGTIYFRHYRGNLIAHPGLWYFLFFSMGIIAALLIFSSFRSSEKRFNHQMEQGRLVFLKRAHKVEITFDDCEFFSGGYSQTISDDNVSTLNLVSPIPTYFHNPVKEEKVVCSYFVYTDPVNKQRFISHTFGVDADTLKYYVLSNRIILYVANATTKEYLFELI